jgi:hypothetical protein
MQQYLCIFLYWDRSQPGSFGIYGGASSTEKDFSPIFVIFLCLTTHFFFTISQGRIKLFGAPRQ